MKTADFDTIELNEAFAAQGLAVLRELGLPDDGEHVTPNGGAIAIGQIETVGGRYGLATMCIGVGQGIALAFERI